MSKQDRTQAERLLHIISSISDHIYVGDVTNAAQPRSIYFSPHLEVLTGYPTEKFMADWYFWLSLIHPDDRSQACAQFNRAIRSGHSEIEYRLIRADGNIVWVRDSRRVEIENDPVDSQRTMIYGVVSDVTERRRHEAEIRRLNESLEQRVADRTRDLSALYEITTIASESLDLNLTLEKALDRALAVTANTIGAIHIAGDLEDVLELATQRNLPLEVISQLDFLPANNGLVQRVIAHEAPLFIPNLKDEPILRRLVPVGCCQTYLGVPMRARQRVVGLLSLFGQNKQTFNNVETAALLTSIAYHSGVAIENHRLYRRAEQAAVMEERERLARELHDAVTQSLCSLTFFAEAGWEIAKSGDAAMIQHNFNRIGETAQYALKEMRLLLHELRPLDLEGHGLAGALRQRLKTVEERANVRAKLIADNHLELPAPIEEGLYRIAQEALNNALKHAAAQSVAVYLCAADDHIELEIVDDGCGFYPDATEHMGGLGLNNMRKRTELLGGSLEIVSEIEKGTRVKVRVKVR